ncbi:MAG: hypothetical protein ACRDJN_22300, partial [Chloroflexota bacterium]
RARRGPHAILIRVDQRASELVEPLLRFALAALPSREAPGVLVDVREHQHSLVAALEEFGFYQVERQLLMVKQLAAVVRHQFSPALEKVV